MCQPHKLHAVQNEYLTTENDSAWGRISAWHEIFVTSIREDGEWNLVITCSLWHYSNFRLGWMYTQRPTGTAARLCFCYYRYVRRNREMKSYVFWDVRQCSPMKYNGRFGGICRPCFQISTCYMVNTGYLLGLLFNDEDRRDHFSESSVDFQTE